MQLTDLYVFVLAGFVGYQIITRVPSEHSEVLPMFMPAPQRVSR